MALEEQLGQFNLKDLTLDVRLKAIIDGDCKDFTGRDIFSVDFFRQSIGFGITDINIEVNTSLQPIIEITFKDLYGNTIFGKSLNNAPDLSDTNGERPDFSALFAWPPPKFMFTFKGFLGRSATWMLNMKKASVSYDSSDGSYNVKCEFVPNQWGFLSDLPFLYLLAVKGLKKRLDLNDNSSTKVQTIFDLIKIGKQVEVKTKETTKEFDGILTQMSLLKANRVYDAVAISKVISYGQTITGQVGNVSIPGFNDITIYDPAGGFSAAGLSSGVGNSAIDNPEKQKTVALNATDLRRLNTFLLLNGQIGTMKPIGVSFEDIKSQNGVLVAAGVSNVDTEIKNRQKIIADNIKKIEDAIKAKTYDSSKAQLKKITIGEIFEQLAKDAGYIMGSILQAGYDGFENNKAIRTSRNKELIGRSFPLVLTNDNKKEEKPATAEFFGENVGVEEYEMAFVDIFIEAISEGIATELLPDDQPVPEEQFIRKRISNVEALRPNPYKPFWKTIAENIMIRGGIAGFLIRNVDPNYPGDYGSYFGIDGATEAEDIVELADADLENITDDILNQLPEDEFKKLKLFCTFWTNFLTADGLYFRILDGENGLVEGDLVPRPASINDPLPPEIYHYAVMITKPTDATQYPWGSDPVLTGYDEATGQYDQTKNGLPEGWEIRTLKQMIRDLWRLKPAGAATLDSTNSNLIDFDNLNSTRVYNNGIAYFTMDDDVVDAANSYIYVLFSGVDAAKTQEVMSAPSDGEIKNEKEEQKEEQYPNGFVQIVDPKNSDGELLAIIDYMNDDRIEEGLMLDYDKLVNPNADFFNYGDLDYFRFKQKLVDPNNIGSSSDYPARNIAISIAYHSVTNNLVFGPFNGDGGLVQLGFIMRICSQLVSKLDGIEEKRNNVIAKVLGKSGEQRDLLYKQMHVLYQQWEVLMIKDSDSSADGSCVNITPGSKAQFKQELEDRYSTHKEFSLAERISESAADNTFFYAYPLNDVQGAEKVNVRNSIINIEPLYKPNGNTTVLNMIQQICTKNNFIFIPMPGGSNSFDTSEIFSPHIRDEVQVKNFFYVQFAPTPEARSTLGVGDGTPLSAADNLENNVPPGTLKIKFGSPENQIVKNINVDTQEAKATAESIVNLQRLVDNENQNKTVTTDCSMLPVMEGRSYKASAEMLGNAQVFPMQFFYLDSIPLFNGLYQIMKVKHNIKPNDMTTTAEGIRMRMGFQRGDFGGIHPITIDSLEQLSSKLQSQEPPANIPAASEFLNQILDQGSGTSDGKTGTQSANYSGTVDKVATNKGGADIVPSSVVSTSGIILPPDLKAVRNSIRLTQSSNANGPIQIGDFTASNGTTYTKSEIIGNMNRFIEDVLGPFATFLKTNYPHLYKNWYITSATRSYVPKGGSSVSQHQKGEAVDSQIVGGKNVTETMKSNLELLNAMLTWYQQNPVGYDQVLWETRASQNASWIHWSYKRGTANRLQLLRFGSDTTYKSAPVNTTGAYVLPGVTEQQIVLRMI